MPLQNHEFEAEAVDYNKAQSIYAICAPVAVLVGFFLVDLEDRTNLLALSAIAGALLLPLVIRWYHPLLLLCWNCTIAFVFLPKEPSLRLCMVGLGAILTIGSIAIQRRSHFAKLSPLAWGFVFFTVVILGTAQLRGGLGFSSMGSAQFGARIYAEYLLAVGGYFILSSWRIPIQHAQLCVGLFFGGAITWGISHMIDLLPRSFALFHLLFPVVDDLHLREGSYEGRWGTGFSNFSLQILTLLYCWYGIRGLTMPTKPWRTLAGFAVFLIGMIPGFRLFLIMASLQFFLQSILEGFWRTRRILVFFILLLVTSIVVVSNTRFLPLPIQRTISFLPVDVDPVVKRSSMSTASWRWDLFLYAMPDVYRYFWFGKGLGVDVRQASIGEDRNILKGPAQAFYLNYLFGNYQNGFQATIIPFGIWGLIGMYWVQLAGLRMLWRHHRNRHPELQTINTGILAAYLMLIIYFPFQGWPQYDFPTMAGMLGFSSALNKDACNLESNKGDCEQLT